jgi:hypothetical protein
MRLRYNEYHIQYELTGEIKGVIMEDSARAPVTESKYCFERSELRVMQNTAANNEEFLNRVADLVGSLGGKVDDLKMELAVIESKLYSLEANAE